MSQKFGLTSSLLALAIGLFSAQNFAHAANPSKELQDCMDQINYGAMRSTQTVGCYAIELEKLDRKLNDAYRAAISKSPPKLRAQLTTAQRAWIQYRDAWCKYVKEADASTHAEILQSACIADLTRKQSEEILGNTFNPNRR